MTKLMGYLIRLKNLQSAGKVRGQRRNYKGNGLYGHTIIHHHPGHMLKVA